MHTSAHHRCVLPSLCDFLCVCVCVALERATQSLVGQSLARSLTHTNINTNTNTNTHKHTNFAHFKSNINSKSLTSTNCSNPISTSAAIAGSLPTTPSIPTKTTTTIIYHNILLIIINQPFTSIHNYERLSSILINIIFCICIVHTIFIITVITVICFFKPTHNTSK